MMRWVRWFTCSLKLIILVDILILESLRIKLIRNIPTKAKTFPIVLQGEVRELNCANSKSSYSYRIIRLLMDIASTEIEGFWLSELLFASAPRLFDSTIISWKL